MKKFRKLLVLGVAVLTLGLTGCGGEDIPSISNSTTDSSSTSEQLSSESNLNSEEESESESTSESESEVESESSSEEENKVVEVSTLEQLKATVTSVASEVSIKLTQDIDFTEGLFIDSKVNLDLNGKKIYNSNDLWSQEKGKEVWSLISVVEGGDLTIDNGTVAAKENDCYGIDVCGGNLVINGGTYIGNIHAIYVYNGELIVNGGNFSIQQLDQNNSYGFVLNCYDASYKNGTAKITVKGGTFEGFNPADCVAEGAGTSFIPETGYKVTQDDSDPINYTVVAAE